MRGRFVSSLALLALAACSFPEVTYATADGSAASDGAQTDSPGSGDAGGGTADATEDHVADVVNESVFEAAPDAPACDEDQDGFTATRCGGTDCCDTDKLAHPQQTGWFASADNCGAFDYDCSGKVEKEYVTNVSCSGLAGLCSSTVGFTGDPGCGSSGPYVTCGASGLSCAVTSQTMVTQACH